MNYIKQMFELQQQLNDATNGEIWTEGATKEGRQISWLRCIYMEAAEAIDSFNWKHWKDLDAKPDLGNARVELVDIWHFIMSEAIHFGDAGFAEMYNDMKPERDTDPEKLVEILEKMIAVAASANVDQSQNSLYQLFALFFQAIAHMEMDVPELYRRYLVKNQLNTFRQDNGYKDGSYVKIWGDVEDNVVAFKIMDDNPELTPEDLYKKLEEAYKQVS
ncbi:Dimeric dUTPase [uncultured Candidatus Thioglobus sp.]|uniref:dUTP diphosphatase n=1 Tax=Bathymodiolus heckerae thiotrophic gill symbiont TaxID=1052212 RepID=UPI0010B11261|nr:dUTP diphosphatase [Bathymodiolus heckerae thiotrophic gill symbiont]CAC9590757.1 Dimeric dUTPase (EC 3.6.1.23) [uncultured Gammaproteobacteria bacterium]CAC9594890.1 Dimeric dUTPase (EC 3.6.1.23) [uncultured Gammaproteobacteria bacterium]SHN90419.1 Dimeric dUTPase [Bathymodiolus heckerae thiotrophic gill symbiont]SMN14978.1 Dimeric dUTPase [uncultured Candidatus Thioglobus sp.]